METTAHKSCDKTHILLTSLGTNATPTTYEWKSANATAPLAPLALMELLGKLNLPMPNRVIAVVTKGAMKTTWPIFEIEVYKRFKINPQCLSIPDGRNSDEIREILESVAKEIPSGANLTLDVTQGLRHFPFVFYALVLYLKSLHRVTLLGAYYGMAETSAPKPIIDLQPLLELPEWFYAVRMFQDQGTTMPMAKLLQPLAEMLNNEKAQLFKTGDKEAGKKLSAQASQVSTSVDWLQKYAFAYESALPLELEKASRELIDSIRGLPSIGSAELPPLVDELTGAIVAAAGKSAFPKPPSRGGSWKSTIPLDKEELKRQAYMIDLYLRRGQLSLAAGLMREWVVSWAIWKSGNCIDIKKWLNLEVRGRYERRLGAIGAFAANTAFKCNITTAQKEFGGFWNQLGNALRNVLHHHAMRPEAFEQRPPFLEDVRTFWSGLRVGSTELPALGGGKGKLLISPQGTRPGVLYSALKVTHPTDICLVVCSSASASSITEAANRATFGGDIKQIELTAPREGFNEINTTVTQARPYLLEADEVVVNMTGGTTLMGIIVQRLAEEAQKLDRPVHRFALIDHRAPADQDNDPFVQGDHHWLD